jgi:hypothetical protein
MLSHRGARGVAKAGLSDEADPENYLGGSSETMYFIGLDVHKKLGDWTWSRRGRKEHG